MSPREPEQRDVDQVDWFRLKVPIFVLQDLLAGPDAERVRALIARWHDGPWTQVGPVLDVKSLGTVEGAEQELYFLLEGLLEHFQDDTGGLPVGPDCVARRDDTAPPEVSHERWCEDCGVVHQVIGRRPGNTVGPLPLPYLELGAHQDRS